MNVKSIAAQEIKKKKLKKDFISGDTIHTMYMTEKSGWG